MEKKMILVGFGGHAKSVVDSILRKDEYSIVGYTDLENHGMYQGIGYLGTDDELKRIYSDGVRYAFITVGHLGVTTNGLAIRKRVYERVKRIGYIVPSIIDDSAVIASDATIGEGTFVGKLSVINSEAFIGKMCIINTGSVIEHECTVDNHTHVSIHSTLCGGVSVSSECLIGAGATIIQGINILEKSVIGAGVTVRRDICAGEIFVG